MFSRTKKPVAKTSLEHVFWTDLATAMLANSVLTLQNSTLFGSAAMSSQVFVRNCYKDLWNLITAKWKNDENTLLLGTSGIGKSTFLAYTLYHLRQQKATVILWSRGETCKLYKADGQVEEGTLDDFSDERRDPANYLLTDGCIPPEEGTTAKILEVSSPRKEYWLPFQNRRTTATLYMPAWTLDELLQCAEQCYSHMQPSEVVDKFKKYGGSALHVLVKSEAEAAYAIDDALASTNVMDAIRSDGHSGAPEDVRSVILHWTVKDYGKTIADEVQAYNDYECEFASEAVRIKVIEENGKNLENQLRNFVKRSEGHLSQLRGRLFEDLAHKRLQEGGEFTIRCLSHESELTSLKLQQSPIKDLLNVVDIPPTADVDTYCKPVASNFGAVDSLIISSDSPPILFQMMTGKRRGIVVSKLNAILKQLGATYEEVNIYFVTPDAGAHRINAQPYLDAGKVVKEPDFGGTEVVQWVLQLPLYESKRKASTQEVDDWTTTGLHTNRDNAKP